jgi:hypothetical protein
MAGPAGADIRIGLLLILAATRQALAIGYLAKIASIRFERLVDWLIGFGSAGDDFREGLLIHVLGLTWAMAGLYATEQWSDRTAPSACASSGGYPSGRAAAGAASLPDRPASFSIYAMSFNSDILPA